MTTIQKRIAIDEMINGQRLSGHVDLSLSLGQPVVEPPPVKWQLEVAPGNTIQGVIDAARPGDTIFIPDGVYDETLTIRTPEIRLYAENPDGTLLSGLWQKAYEGQVAWRYEGGGVYSAAYDGNPFMGCFRFDTVDQDVMLFRYVSRRDLELPTISTKDGSVKKPPYGFAVEGGRVYLVLPGEADPNGRSIQFCSQFSKPLIRIENAPGVTIDGLAVAGAGNAEAITGDRASRRLHIKNVVCTHSRRLAAISDDSLVEWCDYSYPGLYNFADDLIDLNGEGAGAVYKLVKTYFATSGGNAYLEGGLCEQAGETSSKNCEFRFNHIHQVFDGMRLGAFHESRAHHNIFNHCYDDAIEFEHWRKSSPTSKNEVYENLVLNPHASAFSHQDSTRERAMRGPHFVYRNVVWITDRKHSHPPYLIKNRELLPDMKIVYWNNILMNLPGENAGWGSTNQIWWRNRDDRDEPSHRPQNITLRNNILVMPGGMSRGGRSPDSAGNVLVNDVPYSPAMGRRGIYAGKSIDSAGLADPDKLDFSLIPKSIAAGRGVPLEAWWPKNDTYAGHDEDAGVFPAGETMPENWPRPMEPVFDR